MGEQTVNIHTFRHRSDTKPGPDFSLPPVCPAVSREQARRLAEDGEDGG